MQDKVEIAQNNGTETNFLYSCLLNKCTCKGTLEDFNDALHPSEGVVPSKEQVFQRTSIIHHVIVVVGKIKYARSNK